MSAAKSNQARKEEEKKRKKTHSRSRLRTYPKDLKQRPLFALNTPDAQLILVVVEITHGLQLNKTHDESFKPTTSVHALPGEGGGGEGGRKEALHAVICHRKSH